MKNMLTKLVENSQQAIKDGVYDISVRLQKSELDLLDSIKKTPHAPLITEVKFASPSLGEIRTVSSPVEIAKMMVAGGAIGLSILTQPYLFNGSPEFFTLIRRQVTLPLLMKDIMIDKIQIDAAEKIGADYILLIQSLFDKKILDEIDEFVTYAHRKKLKVLVEANTATEFENAIKTNADLVGINNRNLNTLELDINTTKKILNDRNDSLIIISESGIESEEDIKFLHECGAKAFLVGSSIMKSANIQETVERLVMAI